MKKVFALMSLAVVLSLTACGPSEEERNAEREKFVQDSTRKADSIRAEEELKNANMMDTAGNANDTTGGATDTTKTK